MSKMMKFQPDKRFGIKGFWNPTEKGQTVHGYILDTMEQEGRGGFPDSTNLIVQLLSDCEGVSKKDRDSGDKIVVTGKAGQVIGVKMWAGLRGLDRRKDHEIKVVFLKETREKGENGEAVRTKEFDVDCSETPIPIQDRKGASRKNGAAPKKGGSRTKKQDEDEIPF